ncbi:hypothetical protein [Blastococcus sp. TF02-8]|uniref:hypothetical protein n=1 Tax=Blastococcus sp. TF02-8 TaxID=2250574 RepID=UPI001412A46E|nr:hypothetical protein [Blastococcus sp. TF02-8]
MCRPTSCSTCGKTTWAGCGQHVDRVRAGVPADQWCPGHADAAPSGFLRRLLGR